MKLNLNVILTIIAVTLTTSAYAQLKEPTTSVRDTIVVLGAIYNEYTLSYEDYPCRYVEETAISFLVAGEEYKKGGNVEKSFSPNGTGEMEIKEYPYAQVNGSPAIVQLVECDEHCENPNTVMLTLDNYQFIGFRLDKLRSGIAFLPENVSSFMSAFLDGWVSDTPLTEIEKTLPDDEETRNELNGLISSVLVK